MHKSSISLVARHLKLDAKSSIIIFAFVNQSWTKTMVMGCRCFSSFLFYFFLFLTIADLVSFVGGHAESFDKYLANE